MANDPINIINAITYLVPGASFKIENDDLTTLEWNCDLPRPTDSAIKAAVPVAAKAEADAAQAKLEARNAVLAKLGLTTDEIAALLG